MNLTWVRTHPGYLIGHEQQQELIGSKQQQQLSGAATKGCGDKGVYTSHYTYIISQNATFVKS